MRRQCQATEQGAPVPEIVSSDASALPRLKAGITTTLFLFLLGCSSLFEEPAPYKAITADTWQVHCETASSHRPSDKELNKGVDKAIWLVALDSDNQPIELRVRWKTDSCAWVPPSRMRQSYWTAVSGRW